MPSTSDLLEQWRRAGVIDDATAARIREYEQSRGHRTVEAPGIVEGAVYLAAAVIAVGILVLLATNWEHLASPVRILVPAVAAIAALVGGQMLVASPHPGLGRGGQAAWLLGAALVAATAAVSASEAGAGPEWASVAAAAAALPAAIVLWLASRSHLQVIGVAASCGLAGLATSAVISEHVSERYGPLSFGAVLVVAGAIAVAAIETGALIPRTTARVLAAAGLVLGALYTGVGPGPAWPEATAFIVCAALALLSVRRGVFLYMAGAVAAGFIGVATIILRHVDNTTAAALALIATGLALLAGIVLLERLRPWRR